MKKACSNSSSAPIEKNLKKQRFLVYIALTLSIACYMIVVGISKSHSPGIRNDNGR